jgi:hypothetical protein
MQRLLAVVVLAGVLAFSACTGDPGAPVRFCDTAPTRRESCHVLRNDLRRWNTVMNRVFPQGSAHVSAAWYKAFVPKLRDLGDATRSHQIVAEFEQVRTSSVEAIDDVVHAIVNYSHWLDTSPKRALLHFGRSVDSASRDQLANAQALRAQCADGSVR